MARSLRSIEMDFGKAKRQARELDEVAGNLEKLSGTQLEETLNQLGTNWTGDNSLKYIGKGRFCREISTRRRRQSVRWRRRFGILLRLFMRLRWRHGSVPIIEIK